MSLRIEVTTRTPLWTGGVGGMTDRLHETGLLGSLRWWYEAIVRGLGGTACDPSTDGKCRYDSRDRRSPEEQLCNACYVFGATGWKRRFSLKVIEDQTQPVGKERTLNVRPPGRNRGWYLPPGRMGTFALEIHGEESALQMLASLFLFLERWGHLGAKPQLGYGIFQLNNRNKVCEWAKGKAWIAESKAPDARLPDLRRFGFFRYRLSSQRGDWWTQIPGLNDAKIKDQVQQLVHDHNVVPVVPALKNEWRFRRWSGESSDQLWMFGTLSWHANQGTVRVRSKIAVSWAYALNSHEWEIRGWVWLPKPNIAAQVWKLLADKEIWQSVIDREGKLESEPSGEWSERTPEQVIKGLLQGAT